MAKKQEKPVDEPQDEQFEEQPEVEQPSSEAVVQSPVVDERQYRVSFSLPYGALVALLDLSHPDADSVGARRLGLELDNGVLTAIGRLVLDGIDQTAIRHKMLAGYRAAQNALVDGDKTGFKGA